MNNKKRRKNRRLKARLQFFSFFLFSRITDFFVLLAEATLCFPREAKTYFTQKHIFFSFLRSTTVFLIEANMCFHEKQNYASRESTYIFFHFWEAQLFFIFDKHNYFSRTSKSVLLVKTQFFFERGRKFVLSREANRCFSWRHNLLSRSTLTEVNLCSRGSTYFLPFREAQLCAFMRSKYVLLMEAHIFFPRSPIVLQKNCSKT